MDEMRKSGSGRPEPLPKSGAISERLHEIVTLSRDFERHVGQMLMVNPTDLAAMEYLMTEGTLTPSELARRLDISTAATTLVVDRLVALKHVRRHPHPYDRRKVVVVPEPRSVTQAFAELLPVIGGVAALEATMPEAERAVVEAFLSRVVAIYADALEPARSPSPKPAPKPAEGLAL
jgi:DNA-binding MarR family transcriptional regulator